MKLSEAKKQLYLMWEEGDVPSNFTEDHSNYSLALEQLMTFGYLIREELF